MKHLLIALAMCFAMPAWAQENCIDHATGAAALERGWGESQQVIGLTANNTVIEMFGNSETGTWTLTETKPDGTMCQIAAGSAFENRAKDPAPTGDPA